VALRHGWVRLATGPRLPYVEQGDPDGPPVVLVHAYVESWRYFELLLRQLPPSLHVLAPTQRGHGEADRPSSGYGLGDFAGDLVAFMDAVGLRAAVLVGQSSGGYVAQQVAAGRPERTLGLVLAGSPRSLRDKPAVAGFLDTLEPLRDPLPAAFVRDFVASTIGRAPAPDVLDLLVAESRRVPVRVWRETLRGLVEAVPPMETATIAAPTLVLWGDRDSFLPRSDQEALVAAIPGSRFVVYEGCGHAPALEQPERLAADVSTFVARTFGTEP
jgi:pimeloyl-ACP methyl ester carboxylesterase